MKNISSILLVCFALTGCSAMQKSKYNDLVGVWESNEQKTLDSIEKTRGVDEKAKEILKNGFFGRLRVKYTNNMVQAIFLKENGPEEKEKYYSYKLLENTDDYYLVESYEPTLEQYEKGKLYKDGSCYYVLVSKWNFREYFCKVN